VFSFDFLVFVRVLIVRDLVVSCLRPRSNERESDSDRAASVYSCEYIYCVYFRVTLRELCVELCLLGFCSGSDCS
jgi:hypothetical protein